MAVEYPVILSHTIVRLGDLNEGDPDDTAWTSETVNRESILVQDDLRYTSWLATSAADQDLFFRTPNWINNSGFENSVADWVLTASDATSTLQQVLTDQLEGDAAAEVDTTVYGSGTVELKNSQSFSLKEDRIYQFSASAKTDDGTNDTFTLRILDSAGGTLASGTIINVTTTYKSATVEFIATADFDDVRVQVDCPERVVTSFLDAMWFGEIRENDYLLLDQGHNLIDASVAIQHRANPSASWTTLETNTVATQSVYYETFTGTKAIDWRLRLTSLLEAPEIPQIFLGKRWTLTHSPVGFDPTNAKSTAKETTSEAGIERDYHNFTQRVLNANFQNLGPEDDFPDWFIWWLDIGRGRYPFWWIWKPTTEPNVIFFHRLSNKVLEFPFDKHSRSGTIAAREVLGAVVVRNGPDQC